MGQTFLFGGFKVELSAEIEPPAKTRSMAQPFVEAKKMNDFSTCKAEFSKK
jgi:hypothetical protein